jgi:hypothetical protein
MEMKLITLHQRCCLRKRQFPFRNCTSSHFKTGFDTLLVNYSLYSYAWEIVRDENSNIAMRTRGL